MYPSLVGFSNVNWTGSVRTNSSIRTSSGIQGINFFINRTILRSDRGTGFINSSVHDLCARLGCNVEYSYPGQLGMMMIAFITFKSSLVPLLEGL